MKSQKILCAFVMAAAFPFHSDAGTLFYVPIPATGSDAQSGMDPARVYTSGVVAGKAKPGGRTVNGVELGTLSGSGNAITANGVTLSAATGTLTNGGGKTDSIAADGAMAEVLTGMIFNDGAADNSEQYVVLDPATLTAGKTYDLRVYVCNASGENRQVSLSFAGDSKAAVSTDFFNEDDATTSAGGFAEPDQVYYINYRFTWDGVSTPGFTATQKFGSMPFCLYALTNQEVGGETDARPVGAVVAMQAERFAAAPATRKTRTTVVETDEDIGVSSDVFYSSDSLRRNGRWVTVGTYGRCWQPTEVDRDWQPYTRGRWVHSANDGWVWDSDEDFGWATYHYGRWFREEDSGWYWVPGRVWAPSWVSWRHGHSYIGWAPLPPVAIAAAGVGISSWADHRWGIGPRAYNFVNVRDFGAPSMAKVLIPRQQNVAIMTNTNNVTNIVNNRQGIYSGGPNFQAVNNALGRTGSQLIPSVQVNRNAGTRPLTPDGKFSQLTAGVLALTAPMVTRNKKSGPLPPVAATIATPKFDKGWNGLPDPKNSAALQAKIANEMPGATAKTAPAKLPGTPPATSGAAGSNAGGTLKPFRQGRATDTTPPRPGQPAATAGGATFTKPGQPAKPPTDRTGNRGETPNPAARPDQPANPTAATPTKPGQSPATAEPPLIKPGQPFTSTPDGVRNRGKGSKTGIFPPTQPIPPGNPVNIAPQQPGQSVKPAAPEGIPEAPRSKRRPGAPAPTEQVPGVKPTTPAVSPPEPFRPRKRLPDPATPQSAPPKVSTPAPVVPKPAPVEIRTPRPAPPVTAPVKPAAPIAQPNPRPAAPVAAPARPAPPVVAPVRPLPPFVAPLRPAPPVAAPTRPAPPVIAPTRPAVPAPAAPPPRGGKPTPTPGPPTNG